MKHKRLFNPSVITLALAAAMSVPAQAAGTADEVIVVTANRTSQSLDQVLSPVHVLDRQDIERIQPKSIADLLEQVVGLDINRQGSGGQQMSVFTRGTDAGHLLVVVDGQRIGSATLGETALAGIPTAQIERIEVVKGPRAALWGSDAIGGVVQIFTRQLAGGEWSLGLETGSKGFAGATAAAGLQHGEGSTTISLHSEKSDGFDVREIATDTSPDEQPDEDGYDRLSLAVNGSQSLGQAFTLSWLAKLDKGNSEFDTTFGGDETDIDNSQWQLKGDYQSAGWQHALSLGQAEEQSDTYGLTVAKADASRFKTSRDQLTWLSQYRYSEYLSLAVGADLYREKIDTATAYNKEERDVKAYFGQLSFDKDNFILQSALRYDDIEAIDAETTYNVSAGYRLGGGWLISLNAGEGFKAPSFNDLYYPWGGNPDLVAETSESLELLVRGAAAGVELTFNLYQTDVENLIDWAEVAKDVWQPSNVDSVEIEGAELTLAGDAFGLSHQADISYVDAVDAGDGKRLDRRAKNNFSYRAGYQWQQLDLTLEYQYHGRRMDRGTALKAYELVNLSVGYQLTSQWQLRLKANNLTDKVYETASGFNTPRAEYFLSLNYNAL